jgi:hypothetical protein
MDMRKGGTERESEIKKEIEITGLSKLKGKSGRMDLRKGGTERERAKLEDK